MSPTLFRYIFKDLFRVFLMASGALTGIMSFGGMLKPLYEVGLDISQAWQILTYSSPAMMAYSLPIAALFATTMVYGRLGADNETTACRAAGISYLWMTLPAFVLGVAAAFISLGMLCFAVPASMLNVERIVYSNLAKLVAGQIERKHQMMFEQSGRYITIFAKSAEVVPTDPARPRQQAVTLVGPVITIYQPAQPGKPSTPQEFYMATEATAFFNQNADDDVTFSANLVGGTKLPRAATAAQRQGLHVSIGKTTVGPIALNSPVRENEKFMDIFKLRRFLEFPEQSRKIGSLLRNFIRQDQEREYLQYLANDLNSADQLATFGTGAETYTLTLGDHPAALRDGRLMFDASKAAPARLVQMRDGKQSLNVEAVQVSIRAFPDSARGNIELDVELYDCTVEAGGVRYPRGNLSRAITVAMPPAVKAASTRPAREYVSGKLSTFTQQDLNRNILKLENGIISELHARMSFAVSCLILVMVGCALGMMFRSGNFLSAFAVSVIPALLSIALIVTGQHTSENVPPAVSMAWKNPLNLGLALIWSGNALVLIIGVALIGRLQRQ